MLKVAIVGCGKIADAHASQICRIGDCRIVAACDHEPLMAHQFSDRFPVGKCFSDVSELLHRTRPDVVHVTTPPQSHYSIAKLCLESGANVYVEKPFTINVKEAQDLIQFATASRLKLTVGHDDQFSHVARRMRELVKNGYLGGSPVHLESYYCYEIGRSGYAGAFLGNPKHWVRQLPGKLLHNIISHGIARIAEFIEGDRPEIIASGFISPLLVSLGERELMDELRVIIRDSNRCTAYFTFSSQMRPELHQFRLFGNKNGLVLDQDDETLIKLPGGRYPSYAAKFLPPVAMAAKYLQNVKYNVGRFVARDFHMKSGMKYLIESFYRSVTENTPLPITYREILLTSQIMDEIFDQVNHQRTSATSSGISHGVGVIG